MVYGFFVWWYGLGLLRSWRTAQSWLVQLTDFFSVDILLKTWFSPWKNDVLVGQNLALSDQMKLWQQNLASRLVGMIMRTVVILISVLILALMALTIALGLVIWVALPGLVIILPLVGLTVLAL